MVKEEEILKELRTLREEVEKLKEEIKILQGNEEPPPPIPFKELAENVSTPTSPTREEIEISIGSKWLPRLGMVALVFAVVLFVKYAFEHYWIGPTGRIILGLISGLISLGIGEVLENRKYRLYSKIFTGGGLLMLYISLWAAHKIYSMIGNVTSFILMSLVTLIATLFTLRYNSLVVAFYTLIGGFLTPFLVGPSTFPQLSDLIFVLSYITILDLGILSLAFFKKWRILNFAGFLCTIFSYFIIYFSQLIRYPLGPSFFFLTLYFLIFASVAIVYNILRGEPTTPEDIYLILFNTLFYYCFSYFLLKPDYGNLLGLFTFLLSLFYLILAQLSFNLNPKDKYLVLILLGICVILIALGISQQFKKYWITFLWSLEALVLVWIGFRMVNYPEKAYPTRILGLSLLLISLIRLLLIDTRIDLAAFVPILNKRVSIILTYIFFLVLTMKLYSDRKKEISQEEKDVIPILTVLINFLLVLLITQEINDYFKKLILYPKYSIENIRNLEIQRNMWLSIAWALYSFAIMGVGVAKKYKLLRWISLALFGITVFKAFLLDLSFLKGFPRILSFVVLGILLLVTGFVYNKYKHKIQEFI